MDGTTMADSGSGGSAGGSGASADEEIARLHEEMRQLRAMARNRPLVAHAQGILRERYRLTDAESAFTLLRQASQHHNVKLHTLADAVTKAPRPADGTPLWFPGRARHAPPGLTLLSLDGAARADRGAVLGTALSTCLEITGTDMGNVQLMDRSRTGLRIAKHTGLGAEFVSFFDHVGVTEPGTSCGRAARDIDQVTVRDVATDPVFTEESRRVILTAGSRACHSVPLTTDGGECVGMVSAHMSRPIKGLSKAGTDALAHVGRQVANWLSWYDRTIVLDALEFLHASALRARGA
ncbi:ANTAR domain-containing protein [Streptomyces sp. NPDC001985]|uniref:ANTAR domain-containing protein n=1 Tax=Streptomyces sp. NPDC001985 TaxID=3154406 RepID=UPI0033326847